MIRNKYGKLFLYFITLIVSYYVLASALGYYIVDDILLSITIHNVELACFYFRLSLSLLITWVVYRINSRKEKISKIELYFIFILYYTFIIVLTFKRVDQRSCNFNIANLLNDFNNSKYSILLLLGNIGMYIPIGIIIKSMIKNKSMRVLTIYFITAIFITELIQYILKFGVFDINDILLNTLGFVIGIVIYNSFLKRYV